MVHQGSKVDSRTIECGDDLDEFATLVVAHYSLAFGPYCWHVSNARFLPSQIPRKGKLNLYSPEPALASRINKQLAHAAPAKLDAVGRTWAELAVRTSEDERLMAHIESYHKLEDWPNLQRLTATALKKEPKDAYLHEKYGEALMGQKLWVEALASFDEMIRLAPEEAFGYFVRGCALVEMGEVEKAELDLARAGEIDPAFDGDDTDSLGVEEEED